jgi:hypothetical protein
VLFYCELYWWRDCPNHWNFERSPYHQWILGVPFYVMDVEEGREICHSIRIPKFQHVEEKVLYPAGPKFPVFLHYP